MKYILPIILLITTSLIIPFGAIARDTNQVGNELEKINYAGLPYGVYIKKDLNQVNPSPGITQQAGNGDVRAIEGYTIESGKKLPDNPKEPPISTDLPSVFLRFIGNIFTAVAEFFNFGNKRAIAILDTEMPCGIASQKLNVDNPNCRNGQIITENDPLPEVAEKQDDTKVLGAFFSDPIEKGLDIDYCKNLPYDSGDCVKNNTPFINISSKTITPTPSLTVTPTLSVTPVVVQPT